MSSPRPPRSAASPTSWSAPRTPTAPWTGTPSPALCNPSASRRPRHPDPGRDLSGLARWVASQGEGNRNAGLFWAANRALDADPAADLSPLAAAARQAGLGEREITRTLDSARNAAGPARPHPTTRPKQVTRHDRPHRPAHRPNPASPGQRQAARDHLTRLRQHGGTYRSIAAAAVLSPDTVYALASGSRTSTTRHGRRRPHG